MQSSHWLQPDQHPSKTLPANSTLLHRTAAHKHNYPIDADSSQGEWQIGKGAPLGCPQMILLLSGFATKRHTLLCSEPMWDTLLNAVSGTAQVGVPTVLLLCRDSSHSPSWRCTGYAGLPSRRGWGNSVFCFGSCFDAVLRHHLDWNRSRNMDKKEWHQAEHPAVNSPHICFIIANSTHSFISNSNK